MVPVTSRPNARFKEKSISRLRLTCAPPSAWEARPRRGSSCFSNGAIVAIGHTRPPHRKCPSRPQGRTRHGRPAAYFPGTPPDADSLLIAVSPRPRFLRPAGPIPDAAGDAATPQARSSGLVRRRRRRAARVCARVRPRSPLRRRASLGRGRRSRAIASELRPGPARRATAARGSGVPPRGAARRCRRRPAATRLRCSRVPRPSSSSA